MCPEEVENSPDGPPKEHVGRKEEGIDEPSDGSKFGWAFGDGNRRPPLNMPE